MTFHAASREALAAAELRLLELVDATTNADDLTTYGEELFLSLIHKETAAGTLQVLVAVVTAKWSSPRELVDGVESLAQTVLLVRAERDNRLDAVEDELFRLGRIVAGSQDLELVLSDHSVTPDRKVELVRGLLAGKVEAITKLLVDQLVREPRGAHVVDGLMRLADLAAKRRERSVAHVRTAVELSAAQQDRLAATLTTIYSRPIALHVEVDASLAGGLLIKIGDEVIDGSVAGRLAALRRDLAG